MSNIEAPNKSLNKMLKAVLDFYRSAYQVDGKVDYIVSNKGFGIEGGVVELNDSIRGKFYVARVKPTNNADSSKKGQE